jgi:hypothetical protein
VRFLRKFRRFSGCSSLKKVRYKALALYFNFGIGRSTLLSVAPTCFAGFFLAWQIRNTIFRHHSCGGLRNKIVASKFSRAIVKINRKLHQNTGLNQTDLKYWQRVGLY